VSPGRIPSWKCVHSYTVEQASIAPPVQPFCYPILLLPDAGNILCIRPLVSGRIVHVCRSEIYERQEHALDCFWVRRTQLVSFYGANEYLTVLSWHILRPSTRVGLLLVRLILIFPFSHVIRAMKNQSYETIEVTGPQMVMTMKLTTFAWNVWDGRRPSGV